MQVTIDRTDPSGATHTRRLGWIVRVDGNIVSPVFATKREALAWIDRMALLG